MQVLVIGASKGTGNQLVRSLVAGGHQVRAMVRDPGQQPALAKLGAQPVVGDLEGRLDGVVDHVDAVAFCAGSGSSTGADATLRVDLHGAVRVMDLAVAAGVHRWVQLSSLRADDPLAGPEAMRHYLAAMHARDRLLTASGLDLTIVRPGRLTHEEGTGRVTLGQAGSVERGEVPRADVAAVMAGCLDRPGTIGSVLDLVSGDEPIEDALDRLAASG